MTPSETAAANAQREPTRPRPRTLGLAVIGLGVMGGVHAEHAARFVRSGRLAHVVDPRADEARRIGETYGVPWSRDVEAALASDDVEALVIATPPPTHADLLVAAAHAGKHVLCEKPLAYELGPARAALAEVARCGVKLQVGFHRRYDADYVEAKRQIDAGELGRLQLFGDSMRDRSAPPDAVVRNERLLHDMTSHDFDCARWLVGDVAAVTALGTQLASPIYREIGDVDNVVVALEFANGAIGTIDNSRAVAYGFDCRTEVVGTDATLRLTDPRRRHLERLAAPGVSLDHTHDFLDRFRAAYVDELEDFCRTVLEDREPRVTGEDGLWAMAIAAAVERSIPEGRKVEIALERDLPRRPGA